MGFQDGFSTTLITCRGLGWGLWLCGFVVALSKVHIILIFWSLCYVSLGPLVIFITIMGVILIMGVKLMMIMGVILMITKGAALIRMNLSRCFLERRLCLSSSTSSPSLPWSSTMPTQQSQFLSFLLVCLSVLSGVCSSSPQSFIPSLSSQ